MIQMKIRYAHPLTFLARSPFLYDSFVFVSLGAADEKKLKRMLKKASPVLGLSFNYIRSYFGFIQRQQKHVKIY